MGFKGIRKKFKRSVREVSMVFQEVSTKFQRSFNEVSRVFKESFKGVHESF